MGVGMRWYLSDSLITTFQCLCKQQRDLERKEVNFNLVFNSAPFKESKLLKSCSHNHIFRNNKKTTNILKLILSAIDVSRPLKGRHQRGYRVVKGGFYTFTSSSRGKTSHVALEMERELYFTSDIVRV